MSGRRGVAFVAAAATLGALAVVVVPTGRADAASVSAAFSPEGPGALTVEGKGLFARSGQNLRLTVKTDGKCVGYTAPGSSTFTKMSSPGGGKNDEWTAVVPAAAGNGLQTFQVASYDSPQCSGTAGSTTASYTADNAGPVVQGALDPAPTGGWNTRDVTVRWTATDAGVGVNGAPNPTQSTVSAETTGAKVGSEAVDRLGNKGSGTVTVQLDKGAPVITATRSPAPNAAGWNNTDVTVQYTCTDAKTSTFAGSGVAACSLPVTVSTNGRDQTVRGTARDLAGNVAETSAGPINVDKVRPTLQGGPTTLPNDVGWYRDNVTIAWTADDPLSGIDETTRPRNDVIVGEGQGLTAAGWVRDVAGNQTDVRSGAVNIDRTAPVTTVTAPEGWNKVDVPLTLSAADALSGVARTVYRLDGGPETTGNELRISEEGRHSVEYWSLDRAGNAEAPRTVTVHIDKTPPRISHTLAPAANAAGWHSAPVTVTFSCSDPGGSGIASCGPDGVISAEGRGQVLTGTARDQAGNEATDAATVNLDRTAPVVEATVDRGPNTAGWYRQPVLVTFACVDPLSGVDVCPASTTVGHGRAQTAAGTASDAAGNTASAATGTLNVDTVLPSLSGAATSQPNAAGWHSGDVTVQWTCDDDLSGVQGGCPQASVVRGEGNGLEAAASVADVAGNVRSASVRGLRIDRTAPTTTAELPPALGNGWHGTAVPLTLTAADNLAGIAETWYRIDAGEPQRYGGPVAITAPGEHSIEYWSVDVAGNTEPIDDNRLTVRIDTTPPAVGVTRTPAANMHGWNNTPVTVQLSCSDDGSGLAQDCPGPVTVDEDTAERVVTETVLDRAGNATTATSDPIRIDRVAPRLTGEPQSAPNAAGWYRDDVVVQWTAADDLSGVADADRPAPSVVTGEGNDLSTGEVAVTDRAGNRGTGGLGGLKIDRTAPTIAGVVHGPDGQPLQPNGAGWYNSAVVVHFTCEDPLSGVASCSDGVPLADGLDQNASGAAVDRAGNAADARVTGVNVDTQAPDTTAQLLCTGGNGFCRGDSARLVVTAQQAGLSGNREIRYRVGEGEEQVVPGGTATIDVPLEAGTGKAVVTFWGVDNADNRETPEAVAVTYDNLSPTLTSVVEPAANDQGWHNVPARVSWFAQDDAGGSGLASVSDPTTVYTPTDSRVVEGRAEDRAGNVTTDAVTVRLDNMPPSVTARRGGERNGAGWVRGPVTVDFACADDLSGVPVCPERRELTTDGADQAVSVDVADRAGNVVTAGIGDIDIDTVAPATTASVAGTPENGWHVTAPTVTLASTDATSGVDRILVRVDDGPEVAYTGPFQVGAPGRHTVRFWAVDVAGNVEDASSAANELRLDVDAVQPGITATRSPEANDNGWANRDVAVSFSCTDQHSGVVACGPARTLTEEGADLVADGTAVDRAGNSTTTALRGIRIDKTPPVLTGSTTTQPNGAGWFNRDVTVAWTAQDGLSGVDTATTPADTVVREEGRGLGTEASVSDLAGNAGVGSVSGLNIDKTAPTITGAPTRAPNEAGWFNGAVTVVFDCRDDLSGIAACPAEQVVTSDGASNTVDGRAVDVAGNAASTTVSGIKVDSKAPQTTATASCGSDNEFCRGDEATVVLTATDQDGLSGVAGIRYRVNNGEERTAEGTRVEVPVPLADGTGTASLSFRAFDVAGNVEPVGGVSLRHDNLAPTITHTVLPGKNAAGWSRDEVTVHFDAVDDRGGSGLQSVTPDVKVTGETPGQLVAGEAVDRAGNVATDVAEVKLDRTDPVITGRATASPNARGWHNRPVTVEFACDDTLSQIASCPEPVMVTANGAGQVVAGEARDRADRVRSLVVDGLNVDAVRPDVTIEGVAPGAVYQVGGAPQPSCRAADSGGSGLDGPCTGRVTGGAPNGVGTFTYTATARDVAGNVTEKAVTYRVVYAWPGFAQPVSDTAHATTPASTFKAGSTIPFKFGLRDAAGAAVTATRAPEWLTPVRSGATGTVSTAAAAPSGIVGFDPATRTYQFNWQTSREMAGHVWRVGVRLDDGTERTVLVSLR